MIKEAIGTGATIQEALDAAIAELKAPEGVVPSKEVLEQPKKKTLGLFGGSPAKARAWYECPDEVKAEPKTAAKTPSKVEPKDESESNKIVKAEDDGKFDKVKTYLMTILNSLGIDEAEITFTQVDEDLHINISCGDDYGSVIGRRGETLDAIQYLVRLVINREHDAYKRVSINVGNYREKREATLRSLAKKNAAKVRKYGRNVVLEPMNPYERRIIHTTIQEIEGVTSHSVGSDDDRKVVITLKEGVKPLNGGNGNYNRGGKGGYNKNNGSKKYESSAPAREPRSDFSGSLYGKIEVNK